MKRFVSHLLPMLAAAVLATGAAAQPVQNVDTAESFATISDAINDLDTLDGHTILVSDGTYVENVLMNKELKLYSVNGRGVTTIEGISSAGALGAVQVGPGVDNVEIGALGQGFTIIGIDNGAPGLENAAIYFQGNHTSVKVIDNEVVANGDAGLLSEFGAMNSFFEISNNEFSGQTFLGPNPAGDGFGSQFTLPNVPRQLVTMGCGSGCTNTNNILFTNNDITGTAGGLNGSGNEQGNTLVTLDADATTITGNTFAGTTTRFATSLRTRGPNTTVTGNDFYSSGLGDIVGHVFMVSTGATLGDVASSNTFDRCVYIDDTSGTIGHKIYPFAAGAPAGSTIEVLAGTYVEQIVFDGSTNVTLQGAGAGATLIHAPATLATTFTTSNPNKPVVTVMSSTGVSIRDVTVDGLGNGNGNVRFEGVAFYNAGGALLDSEVLDIRETPANGNQHGVGVYAFVDDLGPYSLEVGNCTVTGFQKNAMALSGDGLTVDVHDCNVAGAGYISYIAQNGIQVGSGATGALTDNSVADIFYDGPTWASGAYLMIDGSNVAMSGDNVATDCQVGAWYQNTSGTVGGLEAVAGPAPTTSLDQHGLLIYNLTTPRSPVDLARSRSLPTVSPLEEAFSGSDREARAAMTVTLSSGCLTGAGFAGSVGVLAYSTGEPLTVELTNMTVGGWDYGLLPYGSAATFDATDNAIAGNLTAGFDNTVGGGAQNVEYNWWGAADGPSGAGTGSGDAIDETGFPGSVDFDPFRIDGSSTTACAFTPAVNNDVTIVTPAGTQCPEECLTVDVDIARGDNVDMRGFSVTFQLDELALCSGLPSILEGDYLSSIGLTACQRLDNGGGSYTIDCAILGLPCGQDAPSGTLFSLEVISTSTTGATGSITITDVEFRDCDNQPIGDTIGSPASIPMYDTTAPAAITDLAATQQLTGNDSDGTTKIQLDFTAPGDAETIEVYRAGYGDYPEYDAGGVPAMPSYPPGPPWALTSVGTSGDSDEVTDRDYWYFVAFAIDTCGYVSDVSNMTDGTLNYHLGDVTDGVMPGDGDNLVNGLDVSDLGASYGNTLVPGDPDNYLDVGPTSDSTVQGLPQTDDQLQFEDLIIFAINYGQVSLVPDGSGDVAGTTSRLAAPELALDVSAPTPGSVVARIVLSGGATVVKGAHSVIRYDASALRLSDVVVGDLAADPSVFLGKIEAPGSMTVDAAVLGSGETFPGDGVIAELRFVALEEGARPTLGEVSLRDVANQPVGSEVQVEPDVAPTRLVLGARPNPFRSSTQIVLEVPATTDGSLRVYDVNGRLVTTLAEGTFTAGRHVSVWDGRGADGRRIASGIYFYSFHGDGKKVTEKLLRYE